MSELLVLDVGTSGVRATLVDESGTPREMRYRRSAPARPSPGVSEFDAEALAESALEVAGETLAASRGVVGVAVANQRASTVLWEVDHGRPLGPGLGWQDLRTLGECLALRRRGLRLAPNQSATKLSHLLAGAGAEVTASARFGTLDSWIAWRLSEGSVHVTDASNAAVTGLLRADASGWDEAVLETLGIAPSVLPTIVASSAVIGEARALPGNPPIVALVGDQQASLIGQGCTAPGAAKVTFGTGAMLDLSVGAVAPEIAGRGATGTFPILAWRDEEGDHWGVEAILLSAGSCVDWLRDGLGLLASVEESDALAGSVRDSGGVTFVPAFGGLATPLWDFGARGALIGLDHSTTRAEIVHAVLAGIAHSGADLLEAAERDAKRTVEVLCVDGGMSANATFVQLLADAVGRPLLVSAVREATTLGAAFLGGLTCGLYPSLEGAAALLGRRTQVNPAAATGPRALARRPRQVAADGALPLLARVLAGHHGALEVLRQLTAQVELNGERAERFAQRGVAGAVLERDDELEERIDLVGGLPDVADEVDDVAAGCGNGTGDARHHAGLVGALDRDPDERAQIGLRRVVGDRADEQLQVELLDRRGERLFDGDAATHARRLQREHDRELAVHDRHPRIFEVAAEIGERLGHRGDHPGAIPTDRMEGKARHAPAYRPLPSSTGFARGPPGSAATGLLRPADGVQAGHQLVDAVARRTDPPVEVLDDLDRPSEARLQEVDVDQPLVELTDDRVELGGGLPVAELGGGARSGRLARHLGISHRPHPRVPHSPSPRSRPSRRRGASRARRPASPLRPSAAGAPRRDA